MPNWRTFRLTFLVLLALAVAARASQALAAPPVPAETKDVAEITPPRLSYTDGEVSFWRPGAEDWTPSRLNTALAAGDRLYTGAGANLELDLGGQAYVRAAEQTQIGLANLEPDFIQVEVTTGQASLDVRSLAAGHSLEIDTPNAAFTVERTGYYRVNVEDQQTTFITRRGGQAKVVPAGGSAATVSASEQVVVHGLDSPTVETYVAPDLDGWDRWNYARTDRLMDSLSARYVPPGVAGTSDLDYYGRWRVVPSYGPVWVPTAVESGWVPYSTGRWVWDPYYGWTWVDDAPWGWAPYHYGRWVYYNGFWAWAPGPLVVQAVYAPALVAFYGGSDFAVSIGMGWPVIGWAPLGWGEPCYPWWGPPYYQRRAWWGGWGGPHHWNHHDHDDDHHGHDGDHHGHDGDHHGDDGDHHGDDGNRHDHRDHVIVEPEQDFGRGHGGNRRVTKVADARIEPIRGAPPVKVGRESLAPGLGHGTRPPESAANRPVVATRRATDPTVPLRSAGLDVPTGQPVSRTEVVKPPTPDRAPTAAVRRPPFGTSGGVEREPPPPPPTARRGGGKAAIEPTSDSGGAPPAGNRGSGISREYEGPARPPAESSGPKQTQGGGRSAGSANAKPAAPPRSWRGPSSEGPRPVTSPPTYATPQPQVAEPRVSREGAPRAGAPTPRPAPRASFPAPRGSFPSPERGQQARPSSPSTGQYGAPRGYGSSGSVPDYHAPRGQAGVQSGAGRGVPQNAPTSTLGGRGAAPMPGPALPGVPANQVFRGSGMPQGGSHR